jgi:putative acyl-CoA dehydrogenase
MVKDPAGFPAFMAECELAAGGDPWLDAHLARVTESARSLFAGQPVASAEQRLYDGQFQARRLVEDLAVALQASLLVRHAPTAVADAFCAARLGGQGGRVYGTLPAGVDSVAIVDRAFPA